MEFRAPHSPLDNIEFQIVGEEEKKAIMDVALVMIEILLSYFVVLSSDEPCLLSYTSWLSIDNDV